MKIFTVTKDEYDLVGDWLLYHGNLVGYENLYIIDDSSEDPRTLTTYQKYYELGVHFYRAGTYLNDGQGDAFTKVMSQFKDDDLLLGLDADEFVYSKDVDGKITCDPTKIIEKFKNCFVQKDIEIFAFGETYLHSVPENCDHFRPAVEIHNFSGPGDMVSRKLFYRASTFVNTGCGNHTGKSSGGINVTVVPGLGLLHFHNTGPVRHAERAERIVRAYGYVTAGMTAAQRERALAAVPKHARGNHRVSQILRRIRGVAETATGIITFTKTLSDRIRYLENTSNLTTTKTGHPISLRDD
jgi:hypothetical protein